MSNTEATHEQPARYSNTKIGQSVCVCFVCVVCADHVLHTCVIMRRSSRVSCPNRQEAMMMGYSDTNVSDAAKVEEAPSPRRPCTPRIPNTTTHTQHATREASAHGCAPASLQAPRVGSQSMLPHVAPCTCMCCDVHAPHCTYRRKPLGSDCD